MRNLVIITFLLLLSSCAIEQPQPPQPKEEPPIAVSVSQPTQKDVPIYIETIGHVVAHRSVDIKPQVIGTIIDIFVRGGEKVEVGDELYRIDPLPYIVELEKSHATLMKDLAELEFAKKRLERYQNLGNKDFVSKLSIDEYESNVKAKEGQILIDQAEMQAAKINLDYCTVASPISGKVSLSRIDKGNIITTYDQETLMTILQLNPVDVEFSLTQKEFQDVQHVLKSENCNFKVLLPYGSEEEFDAKLEALDNRINKETGTIQLRGLVENQDEKLWPGQFVRVRLPVGLDKNALLIPFEAVHEDQEGTYIFLVTEEMTVSKQLVKIGNKLDDLIVIEEGIQPGSQIITDGILNLMMGSKIIIDQEKPIVENDS